jgi:hypothetical protein
VTRNDRRIIDGLAAISLAACVGLAAWWAFGSPPRRIVAIARSGTGIHGIWYSDPELCGLSFKFWLVITGGLPVTWLIVRFVVGFFQESCAPGLLPPLRLRSPRNPRTLPRVRRGAEEFNL